MIKSMNVKIDGDRLFLDVEADSREDVNEFYDLLNEKFPNRVSKPKKSRGD